MNDCFDHMYSLDFALEKWLKERNNRDWVTNLCFTDDTNICAVVSCSTDTVLAGLSLVEGLFKDNSAVKVTAYDNCKVVTSGDLLKIEGPSSILLRSEPLLMLLLSRCCSIAYWTHKCCLALTGMKTLIRDTTSPYLSYSGIDRAGLVAGGVHSRRLCMSEGVRISQLHIKAAGSISKIIETLLESLSPTIKIEVEIHTLDQAHEAVASGADLITCIGMSRAELAMCIRSIQNRSLVSVSCSYLNLDLIRDVGSLGADYISADSIILGAGYANLKMSLL